jgi:hypothetical protein
VAAETSFAFLDRATTAEGVFSPIGNDGWYPHTEDRAVHDQQPVEASTMADAALAASMAYSDPKYLVAFRRAHGWFHGENSSRQPLADLDSGACCDGLQPHGVNRNQGAESTLALLYVELLHEQAQQVSDDNSAAKAASA